MIGFRTLCTVAVSISSALVLAPHFSYSQGIGDESARQAALTAGRDTFLQFCAPCHGRDARGNGPVTAALLTKPADLTQVTERYNGKFPLDTLQQMLTSSTRLQTSAHGSDQMPVWGATFTALDRSPAMVNARVANLLAYLESIQ